MKQKVVLITKIHPGQKEAAHYTWVNGRVFFMESPVNLNARWCGSPPLEDYPVYPVTGTDLSFLEVIKHMGADSMAHRMLPIHGHVIPSGSALALLPQCCFLAFPSPAHPGLIHTSETGWSEISPIQISLQTGSWGL